MRFSITALAFALVRSAVASPGISPATVNKTADPGSSFNVGKVVTTPQIPPKPDVVLLVDVTGSMSPTIGNIQNNLKDVITTVKAEQPNAQFAVASFGDFRDPNAFKVNQQFTSNVGLLQAAVDSLKAQFGQDIPEDWINALFQLSNGAVTFRTGGSPIIVLVSDAPSHDPSGGHTLGQAIDALHGKTIRVIGVNVQDLDHDGQATAVTAATGGVIIGSAAGAVSQAIVSGLKNLDVTITSVASCDAGLSVKFDPASAKVGSGATFTFNETVVVAGDATEGASLKCSVSFDLNGTPGGAAFVQSVVVPVNILGCYTCDPRPDKNKCHPTTSCAPTPYGTMCLTRPGFKADGANDGDVKVQWRMKWPVPGHEHRVGVVPGRSANTLCDAKNTGPDVCKEIKVAHCQAPAVLEGMRYGGDQIVMGEGEL